MSKRTPRKKFNIIRLGKKGERVSVVLAKDAPSALDAYCETRDVPEPERKRLMAVPEA